MNLTLIPVVVSCYGGQGNTREMTRTTLFMMVLLIIIHVANVVLHASGLYLLRSLRRRQGHCENQQLYIMNLSVVELVISIINFFNDILAFFPTALLRSDVQFKIHHYLQIVIHTGLSIVFYACMILITIDKVIYFINCLSKIDSS